MALNITLINLPQEAREQVFERLSVQELLKLRETHPTLRTSVDEYVRHSLEAIRNQPPHGPLDIGAIIALQATEATSSAASSSTEVHVDERALPAQIQGVYRRLRSEWTHRRFDPQAFPKTPVFRAVDFRRLQELAEEQEAQQQNDALQRCWLTM